MIDSFQYTTSEFVNSLNCGEILPHYQPIIDLQSGCIHSCELLARWLHPRIGLIYPDRFISYVQIDRLDMALALTLFEWGVKWRPFGNAIRLAVNVGAGSLSEPRVIRYFQRIASRHSFDLSGLILEVTEVEIVGNLDMTRRNLNELRRQGCTICIDDYGSGYAARNLRDLMPVNSVKIDRLLVAEARGCEDRRAYLHSIVNNLLAQDLEIIAEGILDVVDVENCRAMGIGLGQGYGLGYGCMIF